MKLTIDAWWRKTIGDNFDKIAKVSLRHKGLGKRRGEIIYDIEAPKKIDATWTKLTLEDIVSRAEGEAEGMGGVQTFCILVLDKDGSQLAMRTMRVAADDEFADDSSSEPPTKHGLVAQQMRHNEALMRSNATLIASMFQNLTKTIERLSNQNESYMDRHFGMIETVESLMSQKQDRELKAQREEAKIKAITEGAASLKPLALVAGKKLLGVEVDSSGIVGEQIGALKDSLTQDQVVKIFQLLNPDQQVVIADLLGMGKNQ